VPQSEEKREPTYYGQTIPVHVEIRATQVVLAQPEMRELLSSAALIAVGECGCRRDAKTCDHPLEVCLAVDDEAREEIAEHGWRALAIDEALRILETTHRAGLVHVAYRKRNEPITLICSCCTCACNPLRRLRGSGYREEITVSTYVAAFDPDACAGCGTCVERCPFGAFRRGGAGIEFEESLCFGCGLCVSTCPAEAIEFVER
jgi:ferredoxin